ncbi:MAG: hypothetical protein Q8910_00805 [Bacteroidota bacterium]|nr:hypothetical protein [Bacteroidota bacterium]
MSKVQNERLSNVEVVLSTCGLVKFDENGIAEISDKELYSELVTLPFFSAVPDEVKPEVVDEVKPEAGKKPTKK